MSTIEEVLSALNDMNADGNLKYDDYSALHDMVSMITLPAETLHTRTVTKAEARALARTLWLADNPGRIGAERDWDSLTMIPPVYESYRRMADAALAALGIEVRDE